MFPPKFLRSPVLAGVLLTIPPLASADPVIKVDTGKVTAQVSPTLYGLMTEEINYSYDGGLYAELIRNRIFKDDPKGPAHWTAFQEQGGSATIALDETQPVENTALTTCLRVDANPESGLHRVGVANDGFWGIPVRAKTAYRVSFYAKASGELDNALTVGIESNDGAKVYASAPVPKLTNRWQQYQATLTTGADVAPTAAARFVISTTKPATLWLNLVSVFPPTFHDRPNGNRADLMQLLSDMQPAFLRLPGGNYLEGDTVGTRFQWKKTLGPLAQRPGHPGCWSYRSSDGMGLLEYMEWCEDMKAEPLLAVFAGYALKGETVAVGAEMQPYVDEAVEEIEYITGGSETRWGAQRAKDGHPAPFKLNYVEIGNEDGFDKQKTYDGRFSQFYDAIKAKYPGLKFISTVGGRDGLGRRQPLTSRTPDLVDEHYYCGGLEMMNNSARYDDYPRTGPKIFVGEWATREGFPTTNMLGALGDAAWMIGMERNADIVRMASYAPLFVNVNPGAMQWKSDLVGYDAQSCFGSPSYYAQKMFREYLGDEAVATMLTGGTTQTWQGKGGRDRPAPEPKQIPTLFCSATKSGKEGTVYLKVVNSVGTAQDAAIEIAGAGKVAATGAAITLKASQLTDTNSIGEPTKIVPVKTPATGLGPQFHYSFAPYSVTILAITTS